MNGSSLADTRISVIIPTWNGGPAFEACLKGIGEQQGVGPVELIVLDSESEDGTPERAAEAGARVIQVERARFNHGAVRDQGARSATGEILVFTVQDARPANPDWLRFLATPLLEGAQAATSRIMPRPEANPLARRTALDAPMASDAPMEIDCGADEHAGLAPGKTRNRARFDDIASAIRADIYAKVPFRAVPMAEDLQWALDAVKQGLRIVYVPTSVVLHCHEYGPLACYRRYRDDARAMGELLGLKPRRSLPHAIRGWGYEVVRDWRYLLQIGWPVWFRYALPSIALRGFQLAGQWRGSR